MNDKTEGKIPTIITEGETDFLAMLVNAVYFDGQWENAFRNGATQKEIFTSRDGSEKHIDFMNRTAWMRYAKVNDVTVLELPYLARGKSTDENRKYAGTKKGNDSDISMYLMCADRDFDAAETLERATFSSNYIALSVPKFHIAYGTDMANTLKALGVNKAFSTDAEFNKMFNGGTMQIDSIIHKTYIRVDEEGTEAAAVTAIDGRATSPKSKPPEPIVVKFDKPFTFVIRDNANNEILFIGEYAFAE